MRDNKPKYQRLKQIISLNGAVVLWRSGTQQSQEGLNCFKSMNPLLHSQINMTLFPTPSLFIPLYFLLSHQLFNSKSSNHNQAKFPNCSHFSQNARKTWNSEIEL